ncbi:MAG: alpha/beta hydrolase [Desulfobacteraceae bacterium]|nr:alpha/beta hydrolase [Desulfobacteraceae bacterium]
MKRILTNALAAMLCLVLVGVAIYLWAPGALFGSATQMLRWWAGLERHEVQIDDHRWVYLAGGKGETIVFIHGFGADKDRWGTFLTGFGRSYRLIVPDLPGFGENSKIASASYDIPSQVKRLSRFVERIGLDSFHLVGISMGGYISSYYASEYPDKVKSLLLMDAAGVRSRLPSYVMQYYEKEGKILLLYKTREEFEKFLSVVFYRPPWLPGRLKAYFMKKGALQYEFKKKILKDMTSEGMDLLEDRLPRIKARTLIVWGANDRITDVSSVDKFESGLGDSQTVIIENCGHVPYLEKPAETKRAYREFLADLAKDMGKEG